MLNTDPILTSSGAFLAPAQAVVERPAGPWDANRGAGIRAALVGERPRAEREAETVARMNAGHPGASWHFVTHPTVGRILVSVPHDDDEAPASAEVLAELANGRRV